MHTWPLLRNLPMTAAFATDLRVGVGEDDERGVPAQFQAQPLHLVGRLLA